MTALGFFAGICFLPVLLSIIGPSSQSIQKVINACRLMDAFTHLLFTWGRMKKLHGDPGSGRGLIATLLALRGHDAFCKEGGDVL